MRQFYFYILFCFLTQGVVSQNLIQNSSFEDFFNCPYDYNHAKDSVQEIIPYWFVPNCSTPDYFNSCAQNKISSVPVNFAGKMEAKSGQAYAGIILRVNALMYHGSPYYREFLQSNFSRTLVRNQLYCVGFYVSFAENSGLATDAIGMCFSEKKPNIIKNKDLLSFQAQIENPSSNIIQNPEEWVLISGIYRAQGNENYLTIGNFKSNYDTKVVQIKNTKEEAIDQYAYYYIDDVFVYPIDQQKDCFCSVNKAIRDSFPVFNSSNNLKEKTDSFFVNPKAEDSYILKDVLFEFDKTLLLENGKKELDKIHQLMLEYPNMQIEIYGHTDNIGTESYNMLLSENRAKAVFEYLYYKGIALQRMNFIGMGSSKPIADNKLAKGREKNRRVEIKIIKL